MPYTDVEIEQMTQEAEKADEPGGNEKIIHRGDDEVPAPITRSSLESAGWARVYDTRTGEPSIVNRNMLSGALKKTRPDGSAVFTIHKPSVEPKRGTYKCMLHVDDPNRAHYDDLGFATCKKATLRSPYEVRRHMQKRHKVEWAAIQEEREEQKRQEDRDFQRQLMGIAVGKKEVGTPEAPLYVSDKPKVGRPKKK